MRILHYFLGFPPYRTGGLTKYSFDLMKAQVERGDNVLALWPGMMLPVFDKVYIRRKRSVEGIHNFELVNPLPVSLDEGITDFGAYTKSCCDAVFIDFLEQEKPDVIHIHTLMGLYKEFVLAANKMGIRTVFTTHDYFGICPKVTLYKYGKACDEDSNCADCITCNITALSLNKIRIMQSPIYRCMKNFLIVKMLRKKHRGNFFADEKAPELVVTDNEISVKAMSYQKLRAYYIDILEKIDCIHFNSSVSEGVYKKYMVPKNSVVMTITHKSIKDNRRVHTRKAGTKLKITSLAPAKPFKGFVVLQTALDELWESGKRDFELKLFSPVQNPRPYMKIQENGFCYSELGSILNDTDVLVAPSIWYETFGFTVLEAISYGVPVIVSDHVGAKDIVGEGGIVVKAGNAEELKNALNEFCPQKFYEKLLKNVNIKQWSEFVQENYCLYREAKDEFIM